MAPRAAVPAPEPDVATPEARAALSEPVEGLRHGHRARRELQRVADADEHAEADVEHPELRRRGAEEQADDGDRRAAADDGPRAVRGLQRAGRPGAQEHQTRAEAAGASQQRAREVENPRASNKAAWNTP